MKKTLSMLLSLIVILTAMAVCSVSASASTSVDPKTLTPESDYVFFIRDPDANGYLPGDGSGIDPDNPLKVIDYEKFDPAADHPKWYLQTELYQATEMLSCTGGTIVITGPVHIGADESYGGGTAQRDFYTADFGNNTIKFTSVYNGVDYRKTNGAKIIIEKPAMVSIKGQSIWENIDIVTSGTDRAICFEGHSTLVGQGINCYPEDSTFQGVSPYYVSLAGGKRYDSSRNTSFNLTVQSGTYNKLVGGTWGVSTSSYMSNITTNLTIEGNTRIIGSISGTSAQKQPFSGNANIIINDGIYECDIFGVGSGGLNSGTSIINIKINGGDFRNCWSILKHSPNAIFPASNTVCFDFSGWTGTINGLADAYKVTERISNIILPNGITAQTLENINNGGWVNLDGDWYYYENGQPVRNAWRIDSVGWCFLGEDGAMLTNTFVNDSFGSAYITPNGYFYDTEYGWRLVGGKWYFIEGGYAVTNQWRQDSTGWCYLGEDGAMLTNAWMKDSTGWCFLDDGGYWDGIYYPTAAFTKNGWYFEEGNWYFYEIDVKVTEQWRADSMGWCYLSETGAMVTNGLVADSTGLAYITTDGYFYYTENGWRLIDDQWYFIEGGYAVANQWRQDSTGWCFLGEDGAMLTSTFVKDSTGWCYLNENGYWDGIYHDQIPA